MNLEILLCAATGVEARACRKGVTGAGIEVLETGMGSAPAEKALREWLASHLKAGAGLPNWIISTGFAGSRRADLGVGRWVLGSSVNSAGTSSSALNLPTEPWSGYLASAGVAFQKVSVRTTTQIVADTRDAGIDVVDMESFTLAQVAREHGVHFQILRLISDTPERPIPQAIIEFSSASGNPLRGIARGLAATVREPTRLARFIGQTLPLPKELERGWEKLAKTLFAKQEVGFSPPV